MQHSITSRVGPWIDRALDRFGMGDKVAWEPALIPGQPKGEPTYTVVVWFPGAVLGSVMQGSFQLPDVFGVDEEQITNIISQMLSQFREARSQQIAQEAPSGSVRLQRGTQTASGLVIG